MVRAALRHAGGVRIDHAMGLMRLWLIPDGAGASQGAYLSYPLDDLLRLLALESHRQRAIVIGEDLGTVPPEFRRRCRKAGIAGPGIVTLARLSGRPIVPVAVATSNMLHLGTWDRATINLPFSRGAFVVGDLGHVPPDADAAVLEAKRLEVQASLDAAHERAYAMVGRHFTETPG